MAAKRGYDRGTTINGPLHTKFKPEGQTREFEDTIYRWNPRLRSDQLYEFDGPLTATQLDAPFVLTAGNADINKLPVNTGVARAYFRVPTAGIVTGIAVVAEDAMVQNGTDFLTFTALNLQTAGDGNRALLVTTAHHNTTDINAVALNAGVDLTAKVIWPLELTATTASLYVKAGDLIEVTATGSGTPAAVDAPRCILTLRTLPLGLVPTAVQTGGATTNVPIAAPVANSANGEALLQLSATNEAQSVRLDWGDQLVIPATCAPVFTARVKFSAAPATLHRAVIGFSSAYTATLDNTTYNAWFRIDASNSTSVIDLRAETDDNTTDRDDQSTGSTTLTAATYYLLTVDMHTPGKAIFWVDDNIVATLDVKDFAVTHLLQPFLLVQKDSGTGAESLTVDYVRVSWSRI